jgi:uncharacterized membrane protein
MDLMKKKIFGIWCLIGIVISVVFSTISMLYWNFTYEPKYQTEWRPINDIVGMYMIMPMGWVISLITPAGWLSVIGLGVALYKRNLKPLIISGLGSLLFALYWPQFFVAMMGV